jgi:hypothetical protein
MWTIQTLAKVAIEDEGLSTETLADMHRRSLMIGTIVLFGPLARGPSPAYLDP